MGMFPRGYSGRFPQGKSAATHVQHGPQLHSEPLRACSKDGTFDSLYFCVRGTPRTAAGTDTDESSRASKYIILYFLHRTI